MKYVFTLLIFLAAATSGRLHAQIKKKTPNGYPTLYDYRTNNPDGSRIYYADKRSAALMKVSPGNDYKIECNEAMDKDYLTDSLWGIVYKDTVYLNCKPFSGLDWYAKAEYGDRQALSVPEHRHPAEPEIQEHSGRLLGRPRPSRPEVRSRRSAA